MNDLALQPSGGVASPHPGSRPPWYAAVSHYQWLVLAIASAGWVFDAFEGQVFNITRNQLLADILQVGSNDPAIQRYGDVFLGVFLAGGTVGGVFFGWLGDRVGRRPTMMLTILIIPLTCYLPGSYGALLLLLPLYGFFTNGMHAGFAAYFPEIFPHHLRSTGAGFCFNGGRFLAAPVLLFSGWLKAWPAVDLRLAITLLGLLFLLGILIVSRMPETKGQPLPE